AGSWSRTGGWPASRALPGCGLRRGAPKPIARPPNGFDAVARSPQLLAQALHVHVHRARLDVGLRLPHGLEELRAALHATFSLDQRAQQLELDGGELDVDAVDGGAVRGFVEADGTGREYPAGGHRRRGK